MRNILLGAVLTFIIIFGLRYCEHQKEEREQLEAQSALLEKEIKNVGKLIVTEGNYAQVYTYEDWKKFYVDIFSARKKALVVVNAKATVAYDLRKVETEVNAETKTVTITAIPEPELTINPDFEYYDVQQDYLNQFEAADYNTIKNRVSKELEAKIRASDLMGNAENRLISELQKLYILTASMGWTLQYNQQIIDSEAAWQPLQP
ncbi:DUF4230 domain-containing protein [Altibacter sp. HG106]|uniref:DUF4230 domain-containing protein n=1 Tax=Altibacter sp. HG106 TaxID=3023937 RepID=UPI00235100D2|nr:DUF4230 domain-containing protein [Altibacter sp. HG106]MDC7994555.1 DUF4230 domain-containing protein [Altibacter sp. HG106]